MGQALIPPAALLGTLGIVLLIVAVRARKSRGLGRGETVALDDDTLVSERLGLVGRPDRLVRNGDLVIPEEWKSSRRVQPWHRVQLATYFILIEEEFGVRPPHGFIVAGDGNREKVENSEGLRERVLEIADAIRQARSRIEEEVRVTPERWQCRVCGARSKCRQSRA